MIRLTIDTSLDSLVGSVQDFIVYNPSNDTASQQRS